jgi:hypothetical protein
MALLRRGNTGKMARSRLRSDAEPELYTVGQLAELMTIYRMVRPGQT